MILLPCHAFQNFFPFFQNMESCKKTLQIFYSNAHVLLEHTAADQRRWFYTPLPILQQNITSEGQKICLPYSLIEFTKQYPEVFIFVE